MKPERVRQAAEEADQQIRALQSVPTEGDASATGDDGGDKPTADPAATSGDDPGLDTGAAAADPTPPAPSAEMETMRAEMEKAVQRHRTLEGMFRAQKQQLDQYESQVAELKRSLDEAKASQSEPPVEPASNTASQDDVRLFGEDLVGFVQRISTAAAAQAVNALKEDMQELKSGLDRTSQLSTLTAQERFENKLSELAPSWRKLDADKEFIDWLAANGAVKTGFDSAVSTLDHQAVAEVFNLYEKLTGTAAAPAKDTKAQRQKELEQQAAPPKARQTAAPAIDSAADDVWTRSEIEQVYRTRRGRNGEQLTPEQWVALEREIAAAQGSGRVDFNR